jgi:hypothetical protein
MNIYIYMNRQRGSTWSGWEEWRGEGKEGGRERDRDRERERERARLREKQRALSKAETR